MPHGRTGTVGPALARLADAPQTSPLHRQVAGALSRSDAVVRRLEAAAARDPAVLLAALHDRALAGAAPALAAAYAAGDGGLAGRTAVDLLLHGTGEVLAVASRRRLPAPTTPVRAVLRPAVACAAHRLGAYAVALVHLGCSAGTELQLDRVGVSYDAGPSLPPSTVQVSASVRGDRPVPSRGLPRVVARIGVDTQPLDPSDPDDVRWLRACVAPDDPQGAAELGAELALATAAPPQLVRGHQVDGLPEALALVPAGALPVVLTTWTLPRVPPHRRQRLPQHLAAADRPVAWVSVEGVGVAPGVPTLGDRPASGHSTVGLTLGDRTGLHAEVLGRCWGRGRWLSWLADA